MINVEIHWGTTVTEIKHPGPDFPRGIGEFQAQLEEGRTNGTYTINHDHGREVIPYADVRQVVATWTR